MSLDVEADTGMKQRAGLTKIAPATFRGVDCAVLAERYAAYLRDRGLDETRQDPDTIKLSPQPGSANA